MSGDELGTFSHRPVRTPTVVDMYAPEATGAQALRTALHQG